MTISGNDPKEAAGYWKNTDLAMRACDCAQFLYLFHLLTLTERNKIKYRIQKWADKHGYQFEE